MLPEPEPNRADPANPAPRPGAAEPAREALVWIRALANAWEDENERAPREPETTGPVASPPGDRR